MFLLLLEMCRGFKINKDDQKDFKTLRCDILKLNRLKEEIINRRPSYLILRYIQAIIIHRQTLTLTLIFILILLRNLNLYKSLS